MAPEDPGGAAPGLAGSVGALSAAILGAALDTAGLAAVMTDARLDPPGPVIRYANAHFEAVTGYSAEELVGRSPRLLQGPRTERDELDRLRAALAAGRRFTGATINYRKDGTEYRNEWIVAPVLGLDGGVTHWLSIQRDATRNPRPHPRADLLRDRVQAMLDTVRAIATRTLDAPSEGRMVHDRLAALGRAQASGVGTGLEALLRGEVPAGTSLDGPPVRLRPGIAEPLALALHEVASGGGRPVIAWTVEPGPEGLLRLDWQDPEGAHPGSGWPAMEEMLRFALGGETRLRCDAGGVRWTLVLPVGE